MALGEFSLIERYFKRALPAGSVGVGDDAAVLPLPPRRKLVVCKDILIEGRHFFPDVSPRTLGYKSLAVNLSDLAAMGATPMACLLGIGLPKADESWLEGFAAGFNDLAQQWQCPLVGGDTVSTDEAIVVSVTAIGTLPDEQTGLLRDAAQVGDDVWVSGVLGAPDVALQIMNGKWDDSHNVLVAIRSCLEQPEPRVSLGQRLLGVAHAAIDISDGLTQDLGHVLSASGVGAVIDLDRLPVHPGLLVFEPSLVRRSVLYGGDVYELCFTAPVTARGVIDAMVTELDVRLTRVGTICAEPGLFGRLDNGRILALESRGYDHFLGSAP
jgi:thiamine-monophosphate kinase